MIDCAQSAVLEDGQRAGKDRCAEALGPPPRACV